MAGVARLKGAGVGAPGGASVGGISVGAIAAGIAGSVTLSGPGVTLVHPARARARKREAFRMNIFAVARANF
jgi:hypothetical protein